MDPVSSALLRSWGWRADVILVLLLAGTLYIRGWRQLRQKQHLLANGWRLVSYLAGLAAVCLALLSPIDVLSQQLFLFHMIQHLLLMMIAPPLLWLAEPFPVGVWGMPASVRPLIVHAFNKNSRFRAGLQRLTAPGIIWLLLITVLWGWHDPQAYNAALRVDWLHDLEHLSFFGVAWLYWWQLTGAAPILGRRPSTLARVIYAIGGVPPNMIAGIFIAFSESIIYTHYLSVPRLFGISVLYDQQLGGLLMWIPGSMMYIIAALVLIFRRLQREERQPPSAAAHWDSSAALLAPGLEAKQ